MEGFPEVHPGVDGASPSRIRMESSMPLNLPFQPGDLVVVVLHSPRNASGAASWGWKPPASPFVDWS